MCYRSELRVREEQVYARFTRNPVPIGPENESPVSHDQRNEILQRVRHDERPQAPGACEPVAKQQRHGSNAQDAERIHTSRDMRPLDKRGLSKQRLIPDN